MVLINSTFGPILTGVFMSAILAAIMSTAASQLLVASSALSNDLYKGLVRKNASEKETMTVSRIAVLVISFTALFLGMDPNSSIFGIVSFAWAGLGASFGPAVLMSLYWKRMTLKGAVAGVITGAVGSVVFYWLKTNVGGIFSVYELLPAFVLAIAAIVVFSLLDKEPSKDMQDEFDAAVKHAKEN
jgi:sodium/proline symporter